MCSCCTYLNIKSSVTYKSWHTVKELKVLSEIILVNNFKCHLRRLLSESQTTGFDSRPRRYQLADHLRYQSRLEPPAVPQRLVLILHLLVCVIFPQCVFLDKSVRDFNKMLRQVMSRIKCLIYQRVIPQKHPQPVHCVQNETVSQFKQFILNFKPKNHF